jgi:hypothetical protein
MKEKLFFVFGGGFIALLLALLHHRFLWLFLGFLGLLAFLCHDDLLVIAWHVFETALIPLYSIACEYHVGNVWE